MYNEHLFRVTLTAPRNDQSVINDDARICVIYFNTYANVHMYNTKYNKITLEYS